MLLSWLIVLVGNFIGCLLVALLIVYSHIPNMFNVNMAKIIIDTGNAKSASNFGEAFILSLLANYLTCLGLWIAMIGREMKSVILALFIPNFLLMALDLNHLVADMYYIFAGLFTCYEYGLDVTEMGWGKLFYKIIIPELLGSLIGGGILVGVIYWYIFIFKEEGEITVNKNKINNNMGTAEHPAVVGHAVCGSAAQRSQERGIDIPHPKACSKQERHHKVDQRGHLCRQLRLAEGPQLVLHLSHPVAAMMIKSTTAL